jgi:hypothetical protein
MTAWRRPSLREQREDYGYLASFLDPRTATTIASLPVVITDPPAPFALRADAWCHRVDRLLGGDRTPIREVAA